MSTYLEALFVSDLHKLICANNSVCDLLSIR